MKKLFIGLGVIAALAAGALALAFQTPSGLRPVDYHQELINRAHAATRLPNGLLSIAFTEQELTAFARDEAYREGYTDITDLQVACEAGELVASAHYPVGGQTITVVAHITPVPTSNGVQLNITASQVGLLPIPVEFTKPVQDGIDEGLTSAGLGQRQAREIDVAPGTMTLDFASGIL